MEQKRHIRSISGEAVDGRDEVGSDTPKCTAVGVAGGMVGVLGVEIIEAF